MIIIFIGSAIVFSAIVFVIWPFLFDTPEFEFNTTDNKQYQLADLISQRENLLETIKELEFDQNTGKLSEDDFSELNTIYREKAIHVLKEIDQFGGSISDNNSEPVPGDHRLKCGQCHESVNISDQFCWNCGNRLIHRN
ncbi:MAG: hypothetical protein GXO90_10665 [FCB group bacterium]|nr:hypothetical protein [FCB group bacterium]